MIRPAGSPSPARVPDVPQDLVPDGASDARIHVALIKQAWHVWRASEPLHSVEAFELRLLSLKPDALFAILVGRFGGFKHISCLWELGPQWSAPCLCQTGGSAPP
jgi:hypothetical protein